ncbi:MAG: hypothetical protein LBT47_08010 [Deltaproteobacteria bacterium]|jgi:mannose-6-phosphate isomerase class I|nr:hypothetical protein [Deltaproteobacteria bacterium]
MPKVKEKSAAANFFLDPAIAAKLTPLALEPIVAEKPWGALAHTSFNAPSDAENLRWGEIWLACEDFGLSSKVASGANRGHILAWFKINWGLGLVGHRPNPNLPTLPVSLRLERTGSEPGPVRVLSDDELWYVLEAGTESWVGAGSTSSEAPWPKRLKKNPVEPGDRFIMPPGLVNSLGPHMTVLKVLPTGSLVGTLYNWERPADLWDFTPPPKEIPLVNTEPAPLKPLCEGRDRILYQGPIYDLTLVKTSFTSAKGEGLSIICPIKGRGRVQVSGSKESLRLHPGQAVLLPAGLSRYSIDSGTLISYLHFKFH